MKFLASIQGVGFENMDQGFTPSLPSIDYVSSVSGGGYASVAWMTALCFGEKDLDSFPKGHTPLQVPLFQSLLIVLSSLFFSALYLLL